MTGEARTPQEGAGANPLTAVPKSVAQEGALVEAEAIRHALLGGFVKEGLAELDSLLAYIKQLEQQRDLGSASGEGSPYASVNSHIESDKWYAGLDDGIRFPVRVLHARGIETGQSCEGGVGHSYDRPTVDLLGAGRSIGFAALAALEDYGLRVRDVALLWTVADGLPSEQFWRITLWQPWPARADEVPMFLWGYEVAARTEKRT